MLPDVEVDDDEDGVEVVGDDEGAVDGAGVGDGEDEDDDDELVLVLELDDPKGPLLQIVCIG